MPSIHDRDPSPEEIAAIEAEKAKLRAEKEAQYRAGILGPVTESKREQLSQTKTKPKPPAKERPLSTVTNGHTQSSVRLENLTCDGCGKQKHPITKRCYVCHPTNPKLGTPAPKPAPTATTPAPAAGKLCSTCGKATHPSNGRCYLCRPGGNPVGRAAKPAPSPAPASRPAPATTTNTPPIATATGSTLEAELQAVQRVAAALEGLSSEAAAWVLAPFVRRYHRAREAEAC